MPSPIIITTPNPIEPLTVNSALMLMPKRSHANEIQLLEELFGLNSLDDGDAEEKPELIPGWMVTSTLIASLIGLWGNVLIIMATILSKQLGSRTNKLIGILAGVDFVICVYLVQLRIFMLNRWYNMRNSDCLLGSISGLFSLNCQSAMGIVLGIDQFWSVWKPPKDKIPKSRYHLLYLSVFTYSFVVTGLGFLVKSDELTVDVCLPETAYRRSAKILWILCSFSIAVAVVLIFTATVRRTSQQLPESQRTSNTHSTSEVKIVTNPQHKPELLHALTIIACVCLSTWIIFIISMLGTEFIAKDSLIASIIKEQLSWCVIINTSCKFFILFWKAPRYRRAFTFLLSCGRRRELDGGVGRRKAAIVQLAAAPGLLHMPHIASASQTQKSVAFVESPFETV